MRERTQPLLADPHLAISPAAAAASLWVAHRQLLQVARALAFKCQILVLDEPSTSLTDAEADHVFAVLEKLKAGGVTLLYVSHRLPEVFRLCDRITVLRDGAFVETCERPSVTPAHIVRAMVGRELPPRTVSSNGARAALGAGPLAGAVRPPPAVEPLGRPPRFTNLQLSGPSGAILGRLGP